MPSVPMIFTFKSVMVEVASVEVSLVTSFEPGLIVSVISLVAIMSVPCRISIIGISRVSSSEVYVDMNLGRSRINGKTSGYDETKNK
jgi:hypothetical protein